MIRRLKLLRGVVPLMMAALVGIAACDDDPTSPNATVLSGDFSLVPDTIGTQEPIRVVFNRPINAATALDPANFVVTDLCDTLRVPGSVRLAGDTLIFSPSQALPFLTLLSVRIQNILDEAGNALPQPITFQRITRAPDVSDVSWAFLNSPSNDVVTGIGFSDENVGYALTLGGSVYRTVNGGILFGARFKEPDITQTFNIESFGGDTVVFLGARLTGGGTQWGVFRSLDSALTFTPSNMVSRLLLSGQFRNVGGNVVGVVGGQGASPGLYRYDLATHSLTAATGAPGSGSFTNVALSPDTTKALATFFISSTNLGLAHRSLDGGATYSSLTLPAGVPRLYGAGFIDNTTGVLLGDSSAVLLVDIATGQITELGASDGIPVTETVGGTTTAFRFTRARFTSGGAIGWITGLVTRRRPGVPDVVQGVILQSRDGGQSWQRQAIDGAPDNGLGFPPVNALQALSPDFAVLSGANGLVAARTDDSSPSAAACSFTDQ